jgi:hypothetical protein
MVMGSLNTASGFSCAHSRCETDTQPSCSSVVPYRCMCRRIAIDAGPATCTRPDRRSQSLEPPMGRVKLVRSLRAVVPYVSRIVVASPERIAIAARCREKVAIP